MVLPVQNVVKNETKTLFEICWATFRWNRRCFRITWQAWCRKPKSRLCAYCIPDGRHVLMISLTTTDLTKMFKIVLNISAKCEVQLIHTGKKKPSHFHTWKKTAILQHKLSTLPVFSGHQNIFDFFCKPGLYISTLSGSFYLKSSGREPLIQYSHQRVTKSANINS